MSWTLYLVLTLFLTVVFTVFSVVTRGVILGIRDNYLRYYQKAELQWTGPSRTQRAGHKGRLWAYFTGSFVAALLVVELVIKPGN